ncbi:hypothetical protein [Coleofasciculus chthonoplastes]|uniref:hypothetical protein n=1 Tax=Coleofasciculus chthonoplastes TaxID=64178 RepID=UPI004062832A
MLPLLHRIYEAAQVFLPRCTSGILVAWLIFGFLAFGKQARRARKSEKGIE